MAEKQCANCGLKSGKTAKFCRKCGRSFDPAADPIPETAGGPPPRTTVAPEVEPATELAESAASHATEPNVEPFTKATLDSLEPEMLDGEPSYPTTEPPVRNPTVHRKIEDDDPTMPLFGEDAAKRFAIEIMNGLAAGKKAVVADGESIAIGADDGADLVLSGDPHASRRHARVTVKDGQPRLADENSTNGTFIRVEGNKELFPGDIVIVGGTMLKVSCEE